jgi:glycosyltransferase involved in cell wall biosynthesis
MLDAIVPAMLRANPAIDMLFAGSGSNDYRDDFARRHPDLDGRTFATGTLDETALAAHVAACDILVQPYPDGISSRRTSAMAGLRLGVPLVTTSGYLTEPFWIEARAVRIHDVRRLTDLANDAGALLRDPAARARLASAGRDLYARQFDITLAVGALTGSRSGKAA